MILLPKYINIRYNSIYNVWMTYAACTLFGVGGGYARSWVLLLLVVLVLLLLLLLGLTVDVTGRNCGKTTTRPVT